jgi:hypothetical protein
MEESGSSMRPTPHLGEMSITVPAPFAGVSDVGFTAQYRAQAFNAPQRDVPLLFEGAPPRLERLAMLLEALSGAAADSYSWSPPVVLGDGVVILAFRDRSVSGEALADGSRIADYVLNLVRPVVFTFLHDCAAIAHVKLSDRIEMRVSADRQAIAEFALPLDDIVRPNGERLLWGFAS